MASRSPAAMQRFHPRRPGGGGQPGGRANRGRLSTTRGSLASCAPKFSLGKIGPRRQQSLTLHLPKAPWPGDSHRSRLIWTDYPEGRTAHLGEFSMTALMDNRRKTHSRSGFHYLRPPFPEQCQLFHVSVLASLFEIST